AAAHGDRGAKAAAAGLSASTASSAASVAERLACLEAPARRAWVRELLAREPELGAAQHGRPARALALLAARVHKELGRSWLERAELPRAGYVADERLLALLGKLAAQPVRDA